MEGNLASKPLVANAIAPATKPRMTAISITNFFIFDVADFITYSLFHTLESKVFATDSHLSPRRAAIMPFNAAEELSMFFLILRYYWGKEKVRKVLYKWHVDSCLNTTSILVGYFVEFSISNQTTSSCPWATREKVRWAEWRGESDLWITSLNSHLCSWRPQRMIW